MRRTLRTSSFLVITFVLLSTPSYSQLAEKVVSENVAKQAAKVSNAERNFSMLVGKLNEKTSIDFFETPLEDVAQELSDLHGVTIVLDQRALEDLSLETTEPVTFALSDVKLGTALSLILDRLDLVVSAHDNLFLITSRDSEPLLTRVYKTAGLVHNSDNNWDHLIDTITTTVEPDSWEELGGSGSICVYQRNLIVSQSFEVHVQLTELLQTLERNIAADGGPQPVPVDQRRRAGGGFGGDEPRSGNIGNGKSANKKSAHLSGGGFFQINAAEKSKNSRTPSVIKHPQKVSNVIDLDQHVTVTFNNEPLDKALRAIGRECGIDFQIDKLALEELALQPAEPVSVSINNVSLETALQLMLKDLELTFTPRDGYVAITTEEFAQGELYTKLYDVRHLIKSNEDESRLIKILTGTVDPDTWEELGGAGTMYSYYGVFVVSTNHEVHTKTAKMIEMLSQALQANPAATQ